ncbi:MAG: SPOR domain-containing protein [Gammaproteobacteria bacterium]|nr:SPOR domain-containing protein [Gammaproteobacteria bacterium]
MLKILFLFFLLLNAAYFYTQFDDMDEPASSTILKQPPLPQGVDKLTLLRERGLGGGDASFPERKPEKPPAQKNANKSSAKPAVKSAKKLAKTPELQSRESSCFTLGPFVRSDVVKRSSKALVARGVDVKHREVTSRTPRGYWVYLPASKSYQAAKRKVKELQKKGLKDLFIMGKGSHQNAISLGLFTSKSAADSRFQRVKKLGLKAALETQYRANKQTWLDMTVPGGQPATVASITEMANGLQRARLSQRKCQ